MPEFSLFKSLLLYFADQMFPFGEKLFIVAFQSGQFWIMNAAGHLRTALLNGYFMQFLPQRINLAVVIFIIGLHLSELLVLPDQSLQLPLAVVSVLLVLSLNYSVFLEVLEHCFLVGLESFELLLVGSY